MAFLIPIEIGNTGVSASYWRITHVQLDRQAGLLDVLVHGFRDGEARRGGKAPLQSLPFRLALDALEEPDTLAMEALYRALRRQPPQDGRPDFAGAQDI